MTAPIVYQDSRRPRDINTDRESPWRFSQHNGDERASVFGTLPGQLWERIAEGVTR